MGKDEAVAGTEPPKLGFRFATHMCAVCLSLPGLALAPRGTVAYRVNIIHLT